MNQEIIKNYFQAQPEGGQSLHKGKILPYSSNILVYNVHN